ncbi:MAG TPA: YciI family protein [Gaiellaceae bacterium]|nr:YciI family protein [Gaiellaceae bacterium]
MQYMLLVYDDPTAWPELSEEEYGKIYAEYAAVGMDPSTKHSAQLQGIEQATTVQVKDGSTLVTDGPFAETKETLGGYYLIEAETLDDATALAARIPSARLGGKIEVRPVVEM